MFEKKLSNKIIIQINVLFYFSIFSEKFNWKSLYNNHCLLPSAADDTTTIDINNVFSYKINFCK